MYRSKNEGKVICYKKVPNNYGARLSHSAVNSRNTVRPAVINIDVAFFWIFFENRWSHAKIHRNKSDALNNYY